MPQNDKILIKLSGLLDKKCIIQLLNDRTRLVQLNESELKKDVLKKLKNKRQFRTLPMIHCNLILLVD